MNVFSFIKMLRTKDELLFLRSEDAKYNNDYDFFFQLRKPILRVKSIQIQTYNIPFAFPNINSYNNTINITETGHAAITATIPTGTYDISSLITALKTSLDTASGGTNTFTISFSDVTNKLSITSSTTEFTISYTNTSMKSFIGLTADISTTLKTLTMQTTVNTLTTSELRIHLPSLVNSYESSNASQNRGDMIMNIPLSNAEPYTSLTNSYPSTEITFDDIKNIYDMTISIVDNSGYTPELWNVSQYGFTLLFKVTVAL